MQGQHGRLTFTDGVQLLTVVHMTSLDESAAAVYDTIVTDSTDVDFVRGLVHETARILQKIIANLKAKAQDGDGRPVYLIPPEGQS